MSNTKQLSHYIDGQWVAGSAASDSLNPSNTTDVVAQALVPRDPRGLFAEID